jgi:hypothetical protein
MDKKDKKIIRKNSSVIYPKGFGIGGDYENKVLIIDFIENSEKINNIENIYINGSYAIPIKKAKDFINNIEKVIKEMENAK